MIVAAIEKREWSIMAEDPDDHHNNSNKEHEQGDPIHAMHELNVYILRCIGVTPTNIKVSEYLLPYTIFHNPTLYLKLRKFGEIGIFAPRRGISSFG